ncbi:biotin transport system substrate-specific component [Rhizobiales bacterium GAS191]|jgi:biotin transport system substrate-specific component|nr:biotin transport system substrate-specific component [Rhizobiales bacterium GAS191]
MSGTGIEDTLASAIWPRRAAVDAAAESRESGSHFVRDTALCVAAVALLTLSAKISVPFLPVPMTLQTFAVLSLGAAYGVRLSVISIIVYLACGVGGLPVFANTPPLIAGPAYLFGPTGGFLIGFIPAAALMGLIAEAKFDRSFFAALPCALIADTLIFLCGFLWLAFAARIGANGQGLGMAAAWSKGVEPFLLGDFVKAALTAAVFPAIWSLIGTREPS